MEKSFYDWLYRKYGWSKDNYAEMEQKDVPFAEDLMLEYYGEADRANIRKEYERKTIYENSAVR